MIDRRYATHDELRLILNLHRQGLSVRAIAEQVGRDPQTVNRAVDRLADLPEDVDDLRFELRRAFTRAVKRRRPAEGSDEHRDQVLAEDAALITAIRRWNDGRPHPSAGAA